jgi:hypothetical protein
MSNGTLTVQDLSALGERFGQTSTSTSIQQQEERPLLQVLAEGLWTLGGWALRIPLVGVRPAPDVQVMARELRQWTGWSSRRLAAILDTTHTTIRAVEDGRPLVAGHSGDLRRRLEEAYAVVLRVHMLANRNPQRTVQLLETAPRTGASAAITALKERDPARAYLAALDVLNPPAEGFLVGTYPAPPGRATASLHG